ncbi:MAG: glucoamylase family protein [Gemmatimonadaceae bacterium]
MRLATAPILLLSSLLLAGNTSCLRPTAPRPAATDTAAAALLLTDLQHRTFGYFWDLSDPQTGLTPDRWPSKSFSSIAAVGFALTAYPIGIEHAWISRAQGTERTLNTLKFFWNSKQGSAANGMTGYRGFYYHFLDMTTGLRFEQVELSTIDTALLLGGVLFCQSYFDGADPKEQAIRAYADSLYARVEWTWIQPHPPRVNHRWRPEDGFSSNDWSGYDESMLLYVLALGSPTYPIDAAAWSAYTSTNRWAEFYGQTHVNFEPLFGHQYSHVWIDFQGIQDPYMKGKGIDYFENSRRATYAQRAYAMANPNGWTGYGANLWGISASDGPLDSTFVIGGRSRTFHTYWARGVAVSEIRDDGTLAPTAAGGSIAFAPEIAVPALVEMKRRFGDNLYGRYGFLDAFNPTLSTAMATHHGKVVPGVGWFDSDWLGIDQGPIVAMIENYNSQLIWKSMRKNPYIVRGLKRAGFTGGWLDQADAAREGGVR